MEIYLIRHTKPKVDEGVCYGQSDLPLFETFEEEWACLKRKLPDHFDIVYTSPLQRCRKLAELIRTDSLRTDPHLMEVNFGDWELKKWDEINAEHLQAWMDDYVNVRPPNGEAYTELYKRSTGVLNTILNTDKKTIAVVSHGGTIRAMIADILSLPLQKAFNLSFDYGRVSLVSISDNLKTVKYLNL